MAIIWLASYPRSGNTWLRFLLQAYLHDGEVDGMRLRAEIPGIHGNAARIDPDASDRLLVKTHFPWSARHHPHAAKTRGFIYILRHPKDVLLSFLNYRKLGGALPVEDAAADREYALQFCRAKGDADWARGFGTWPQHIASWLAAQDLPRAAIRYENLLTAPAAELRPVIKLLGLEIDEARLAAAIESCRFSRLREMEMNEKRDLADQPGSRRFFEGAPALAERGVMFMNEGRSGRTLAHLGDDVEAEFNEAFGPYLATLGYDATAPTAAAEAG